MNRKFLEDLGLDKEIVDKILDENSRDIGKEKAKADQATADLKDARDQLAQRDSDLEELKKTAGDAEATKKQLEDLQGKYNTETEQYKAQLAERDYTDAVTRSISGASVKFSSKAAEKAFISDLKANKLTLKEGELEGFADYLKKQKEADPDAFQSDKPVPKIVGKVGAGSFPTTKAPGQMSREEIYKRDDKTGRYLLSTEERQRAIAASIENQRG